MIVLDASVAVKWYIVEAMSPDADELFIEHVGSIFAPPVFQAEVVGALVRRANMDKATRPKVEAWIAHFAGLCADAAIHSVDQNIVAMQAAAELALDLGHPIKGCLYLQLAMAMDCPLITFDARFAKKAREVWAGVRVLGERGH